MRFLASTPAPTSLQHNHPPCHKRARLAYLLMVMRIQTCPPRIQHRNARTRNHLRRVPINRPRGIGVSLSEELSDEGRNIRDSVVGSLAAD